MITEQSRLRIKERFDDKWIPVPESGCWLWTAGVHSRGYGEFWLYGQGRERVRMDAHRYSYIVHNGPIPEGMHILHQCDIPSCVNPAHLSVGTDAENKADMMRKKRQAAGERNGAAKHRKEAVKEVLALHESGVSQAQIVRQTGIPRSTVNNIVRGRTWRSL